MLQRCFGEVRGRKRSQDGEYYLTVLLEEDVAEEYGLSDDSLTLETVESIFNQVIANSGFVGITMDVTIPEGATEKEIGVILKEGRGEYCRIFHSFRFFPRPAILLDEIPSHKVN